MPSINKPGQTKKTNANGAKNIRDVSSKGKTLGAEHSSHGDFGAEKRNQKDK